MAKRLTKAQFVARARDVHGDKYDYSDSVYDGHHNNMVIRCPIHGEFTQLANLHLNGHGCRPCSNERLRTERSLSDSQFVTRARAVHGDLYDYSKSKYVNNRTPVIIDCPIHGEFEQRPVVHLRGHGCNKCGKRYIPTTKEWIRQAKAVHGKKYKYTKTVYVNQKTKVIIDCSIHGEFTQNPANHLRGQGCSQCGHKRKMITYVEAKKIMKPFQLGGYDDYGLWWKANKPFCLKVGLPRTPDQYYKKHL